jgi:hypothetical protein
VAVSRRNERGGNPMPEDPHGRRQFLEAATLAAAALA